MRKVKSLGLAAVVATAVLAGSTSAASAHRLELVEPGTGPLASGANVDAELNFTLATERGAVSCRTYQEGTITNGERVDTFTSDSEHDECEGPAGFTEGSLGVFEVRLGVSGKATATVAVAIPWAAPYEGCVYSLRRVRGANTLSGKVEATFAGRVRSSGCHEKPVQLESTYWYVYARSPTWEQLEAYVL